MTVACHFACLAAALSASSARATVRSESSGAISAAPSSVAFWTMRSMFCPLGTACASVIRHGSGGVLPLCKVVRCTSRLRAMPERSGRSPRRPAH